MSLNPTPLACAVAIQLTEAGTTVTTIGKVEQFAKALQVSVCWLAFGLGRLSGRASSASIRGSARPRADRVTLTGTARSLRR